ncbi:Mth938-like domain-containing protein [Desulfolithobacter sp.]
MIEEYSFGHVRIQGETYTADILLQGDRVLPGWWRKKGHGCSLDDILEVLKPKPEVFILGTGSPGLLRPDPDLERELAARGILLIAEPTAVAVQRYNELLRKREAIAGGLHLTC